MSRAPAAAPPRPVSPTRAVLAEVENGVSTVPEIARRTGMDPSLVDTAIERLVAAGYLDSEALRLGCPPSGCSTCSSAGPTGCATVDGGRPADGPVLVTLTLRPRPAGGDNARSTTAADEARLNRSAG